MEWVYKLLSEDLCIVANINFYDCTVKYCRNSKQREQSYRTADVHGDHLK